MEQHAVNALCRAIYSEAQAFQHEHHVKVDGEDLGYKVLYGPPLSEASMLILGYQPGGSKKEAVIGEQAGERHHWPSLSEYKHASWKLARTVRSVFNPEDVASSTGLNAVFFRAPSIAAWNRVDPIIRRLAEKMSAEWTESLIKAIRPRKIIVIGLSTFDKLTRAGHLSAGKIALSSDRCTLVKSGKLWSIPTFGTIHLSGARISKSEFEMMRQFFLDPQS